MINSPTPDDFVHRAPTSVDPSLEGPKPAPGDVAGLIERLRRFANNPARYASRHDVETAKDAADALAALSLESAKSEGGDHAPTALGSIAAERARQISVEGWTPEHDDGHGDGALAIAAACYAAPRAVTHRHVLEDRRSPPVHAGQRHLVWPWDFDWWKPKAERENLVRAGALIVAEIERLDRLADNHPNAREEKADV
jgi:hypothetical protein